MNVLNWIPQVKSNNISIESTSRLKPILLTALKLKSISTKEDNFKRTVLYLRILEPNPLNIVNQDMSDRGITGTSLPFWYMLMIELILKASSQNCKRCV